MILARKGQTARSKNQAFLYFKRLLFISQKPDKSSQTFEIRMQCLELCMRNLKSGKVLIIKSSNLLIIKPSNLQNLNLQSFRFVDSRFTSTGVKTFLRAAAPEMHLVIRSRRKRVAS